MFWNFAIYWNQGAFDGHSLGKPYGMMERWSIGMLGYWFF